MKENTGIYIHIPFCVRKCNYCAFLSAPSDEQTREDYVQSLIKEIGMRSVTDVCDTVYFGGGTPSVLKPEQIERILDSVRTQFSISEDAEITIEANPGTLGDDNDSALSTLKSYRRMGINRLSMGVQSMDDDRLRYLGRIHNSETVRRDLALAREAGFDNINLDIIFSVPGETLEEAMEDIRQIAELEPEHISFYSLQLEEGTPLFEQWESGAIEEVSDDVDRETYHRGCSMLKALGYEQYEISNFARMAEHDGQHDGQCDDRRSRHNSKYWSMTPYVGIGLGASGFEHGTRYRNLTKLSDYEAAIRDGKLPVEEEHVNTAHDNISESVFLGLRRIEGVKFADVPLEEAGLTRDEKGFRQYYKEAMKDAHSFEETGHLIIDDEGIRLTETGIDISNSIMALFV